jgi:hypothetical protein
MITKREWQTARRDVVSADRKRLVEPPTAEEMLAYTNGELDPAREQRVREALAAWPELARTLSAEFPAEGNVPDDIVDAQWAKFQRGLTHAPSRPRTSYGWLAVAATIALAFAGLYWRAERDVRRLQQPRVISGEYLLMPGGSRGANDAATLIPAGKPALVRLAVMQPSPRYRVELRDARKTLWQSASVESDDQGVIALVIPAESLAPGRYELVLYGARGEELTTYALRVSSS